MGRLRATQAQHLCYNPPVIFRKADCEPHRHTATEWGIDRGSTQLTSQGASASVELVYVRWVASHAEILWGTLHVKPCIREIILTR